MWIRFFILLKLNYRWGKETVKLQTSSEKDDVDLNGEYTEKCVIVINKDFFISLLYNFFI